MSHPLGNLLRKYREIRGLSLRMLAARMHCSSAYISKIEVGKSAPAEPAFLDRLAVALELTPKEAKLLLHNAAISQRVIELAGPLSPKAYEVSYLFALCLAALTENDMAEMEKILNRAHAGREICGHPN
jgi:transcriptional regulator with XRE-family HTH domain